MKSIETIIKDWQRKILSPICINQCTQNCCNIQGQLVEITSSQAMRIFNVKDIRNLSVEGHEVETPQLTKNYNENYIMQTWQSKEKPFCRVYDLQTKKCKIEDNKPLVCREYPNIVEENEVRLSLGCYASNKPDAVEELRRRVEPLGFVLIKD